MTTFRFRRADEARAIAWPVSVQVPQDGGGFETQGFTARFRVLSDAELDELQARVIAAAQGAREASIKREPFDVAALSPHAVERALLDAALAGADLVDERGASVPFDAGLKAELIADPHVRAGLVAAYGDLRAGFARKN